MKTAGYIKSFSHNHITIEIDGDSRTTEQLQNLGNEKVVVEVNKYRNKRSRSANNYFWELVSQIAVKLQTDRQTIYLWLLKEAGVMVSMTVLEETVPTLEEHFRLVEVLKTYEQDGRNYSEVNCFYGSSTYNTKEMAHLIEVTRQLAIEQGCDVLSEEEERRLYENYTGSNN